MDTGTGGFLWAAMLALVFLFQFPWGVGMTRLAIFGLVEYVLTA